MNGETPEAPGDDVDFRALLMEERAGLLAKLAQTGSGAGVNTAGQATPDSNQTASWRGESKSPVVQAQEAVAEIEKALGRLDDGTYGHCEGCGHAIPPERLEALPATRRCLQCAQMT
jgi:DnaK suppressor protein